MLYNLIVCGSRTYSDRNFLFRSLDALNERLDRNIIHVVTGGASGADTIAHDWATYNGITAPVFPADWTTYGKSAGPRRNQQMMDWLLAHNSVDTVTSRVVAFVDKPLKSSKGTAGMCRIAHTSGVPYAVLSSVTGELLWVHPRFFTN